MSNPQHPDDELKDALMGRAQETAHVQSRFAHLGRAGQAPGQPEPGAVGPLAMTGVPGPAHAAPPERTETLLSSTEGRPRSVAAVLRFCAAGFAFLAVLLFVLPELRGSFQAPSAEELNQPSYTMIAPLLDTPAPPEGSEQVIIEQTAPFDGAAILMVESEPGSAAVRVDGNPHGSTPLSLTLDCIPGKPLKVEVAHKGYERAQHLTFCRADTMIKLSVRLRKAGKKPGSNGSRK